ncbi:MAG: hypothetical protein ACE5KX_06575 [Acidimicrobiia bacterium]
MTEILPYLVGYPRIGPQRELKWALERYWSGRIDRAEFDDRSALLRQAHLDEQRELLGDAVDDFFLYDEVLETALMYGLVPPHLSGHSDDFAVLSDLARGTPGHEAWEMTKWFDSNYHYVVPEIEAEPVEFRPLPWRRPLDEAAWAVLGPYSLVKLSKLTGNPEKLADALGRTFWGWVRRQAERTGGLRLQLNEPCLGLLLDSGNRVLIERAYADPGDLGLVTPPLISIQFGRATEETVRFFGANGFAVQLGLQSAAALQDSAAWALQPEYLVSVLDGRSVWPDDYDKVAALFGALDFGGKPVRITTSTSLMFLPYTVKGEELPDGFQFTREKAAALRVWAEALSGGPRPPARTAPIAEFPEIGEPVTREPRPERRAAQADLDLPPFPTTTTGSLPQTPEVRQLRAGFKRGEIGRSEYDGRLDELIRQAIAWQESLGLDVLVHGEFERSDMVEYFAEQMDGFYTTKNGWVLSYGSRCARPPILAAPPSISQPMTVREWRVAQDATTKPVKGMLTGPVTIVNWSFRPPGVRDDKLFWAVARPIAREVSYLVEAGARVVQVDEPAVRERWPLDTPDAAELRESYTRGVRAALNLVFSAPPGIQMHTHMCYGDFGAIVPLWSDAGVDVAAIEFSRSKDDTYIHLFYELFDDGHLKIGPGLFDVHSPHTPGSDVMEARLQHFLEFMSPENLWVNPDCGLKTRTWDQIEVQISDMVRAAHSKRAELGAG